MRPRHPEIYATGEQMAYLRRLYQQAVRMNPVHPPIPWQPNFSRSWLKSEASSAIDAFKASIGHAKAVQS